MMEYSVGADFFLSQLIKIRTQFSFSSQKCILFYSILYYRRVLGVSIE